jgi:hypothetical protein
MKEERESKNRKKKRMDENGNITDAGRAEPPKKSLTAYIIYFQDKKPTFVERYPSIFLIYSALNLSELTKLIAKEWK